ncbi:hypothetical protein LJC46_03735 [Desulfovibrio sp. OttesenSCG-928-G15]|nr:hypothetical protein [Desulfovibrio sp. OttesenSCG-928-G15]
MWQIAISVLVILGSLFMAFKRYRNSENGYTVAWIACALVNAYYLMAVVLPRVQAG